MSRWLWVGGGAFGAVLLGVGAAVAGAPAAQLVISFTNVAPVPTFGEWGIVAFILALAVSSFTLLKKRGAHRYIALGLSASIAMGAMFAARPVLAFVAPVTPAPLTQPSPNSFGINASPQTFNVTNGTNSTLTIDSFVVNQDPNTSHYQITNAGQPGSCNAQTTLTTADACTVTVQNFNLG